MFKNYWRVWNIMARKNKLVSVEEVDECMVILIEYDDLII